MNRFRWEFLMKPRHSVRGAFIMVESDPIHERGRAGIGQDSTRMAKPGGFARWLDIVVVVVAPDFGPQPGAAELGPKMVTDEVALLLRGPVARGIEPFRIL